MIHDLGKGRSALPDLRDGEDQGPDAAGCYCGD